MPVVFNFMQLLCLTHDMTIDVHIFSGLIMIVLWVRVKVRVRDGKKMSIGGCKPTLFHAISHTLFSNFSAVPTSCYIFHFFLLLVL